MVFIRFYMILYVCICFDDLSIFFIVSFMFLNFGVFYFSWQLSFDHAFAAIAAKNFSKNDFLLENHQTLSKIIEKSSKTVKHHQKAYKKTSNTITNHHKHIL